MKSCPRISKNEFSISVRLWEDEDEEEEESKFKT